MAGIYLHIPFCKQACHYCDFHFSTSLKTKPAVLNAMHQELDLRKQYLPKEPLNSIYFGGGTPSILETEELRDLLKHMHDLFEISPDAEITLEANPDDLSKEKLEGLFSIGINRLSIGIQSFFEEDLKWMNRAHNAQEANQCIELAKAAGFSNFTIDLIYGLPHLSNQRWLENVDRAIELGAPHISAYCLTVEEKTALDHFIKKGTYNAPNDDAGLEHFNLLMDKLVEAGYEHYEISNFAKPGMYAKHNTAYWQQALYLGIGPGAHSFDGKNRQWNLENNAVYAKNVNAGIAFFEEEELSLNDRYNEYIMTTLRTVWGIDVNYVSDNFEVDLLSMYALELNNFRNEGWISVSDKITLTKEGKAMADHIAGALFLTD